MSSSSFASSRCTREGRLARPMSLKKGSALPHNLATSPADLTLYLQSMRWLDRRNRVRAKMHYSAFFHALVLLGKKGTAATRPPAAGAPAEERAADARSRAAVMYVRRSTRRRSCLRGTMRWRTSTSTEGPQREASAAPPAKTTAARTAPSRCPSRVLIHQRHGVMVARTYSWAWLASLPYTTATTSSHNSDGFKEALCAVRSTSFDAFRVRRADPVPPHVAERPERPLAPLPRV